MMRQGRSGAHAITHNISPERGAIPLRTSEALDSVNPLEDRKPGGLFPDRPVVIQPAKR